jgi:hypothetical protein
MKLDLVCEWNLEVFEFEKQLLELRLKGLRTENFELKSTPKEPPK